LQRSARFSADASHQLKTPVSVLRAGLEEIIARVDLTPEVREEVSELIHQSFRLTSVVDDLLLLSRMDAGRLQLELSALDLSLLIAAELDDLSVRPDAQELEIESEIPAGLRIRGEKRYAALIIRNLLENAAKYNHRNGQIRVTVTVRDGIAKLVVANTGHTISQAAQTHIFDRFHRGGMGENLPGHGLGLNIARELARIHGGDLRLLRSEGGWTEFEASFLISTGRGEGIPALNQSAETMGI
jgi:signal transduction histidine kinase